MKILQVNNFYNRGSTGKITCEIHRGLMERDYQSVVCYGRGESVSAKNVIKICSETYSKINNLRSRITGIMYGGFGLSTRRLKKIIRKEKPDVVHLQCINCYFINIYDIVDWLKKNSIKTVLTLHAEFMYTANCGHALECERWRTGCGKCPRWKQITRSVLVDNTHRSFERMSNAFKGFENNLIVVSVSPWLRERAQQSPMLSGIRHEVIYNGVDVSTFHPRDCEELRNQYHLDGKSVIFHATPSFSDDPDHLKGGWYVLEMARRMQDVPVVFIVAGKYRLTGPVPDNVILLGNVEDQNILAEYYSLADVTLLTSKKETFSMVCAESLCCGTPVFGFKAGAPELIALQDYSKFADYGDIEKLELFVRQYLDAEPFDKQRIVHMAENTYSINRMLDGYIQLYEKLSGGLL